MNKPSKVWAAAWSSIDFVTKQKEAIVWVFLSFFDDFQILCLEFLDHLFQVYTDCIAKFERGSKITQINLLALITPHYQIGLV